MTELEVKDYCESVRPRVEECGYSIGHYVDEDQQLHFSVQGPSVAVLEKRHVSTFNVTTLKGGNMTSNKDILDSYVKTFFARIGKYIVDPNL